MRKKWIVPAALLAIVLSLSTYAFAATAGTLDLNLVSATRIQPPAGATTTGGKVAKVEWMGETVTRPVGKKATLVSGVDLFKLTLVSSSYSDRIRIEVLWTDPQNAGQVLNNPNSYIRARVYYYGGPGGGWPTCDAADQRLVTVTALNDTTVCPTTSVTDFGEAILTKRGSARYLMPSTAGQDTLWVLGDIVVPGGVPAGQQSQLSGLGFVATVLQR